MDISVADKRKGLSAMRAAHDNNVLTVSTRVLPDMSAAAFACCVLRERAGARRNR